MPSVEEKSLMLAELMRWEIDRAYNINRIGFVPKADVTVSNTVLQPYAKTLHGQAQFAAILLDHLQKNASENAITRIANKHFSIAMTLNVDDFCSLNQANILDEILRMNGKM